jgi:hypothetical protein
MGITMKLILVTVILLGLLLSATIPAYSYSNVVAQRTSDEESDHESMLQIGMTPGGEATIAGGALLGSGGLAYAGTYFIFTTRIGFLSHSSISLGGGLASDIAAANLEYYENLLRANPRTDIGTLVAGEYAGPIALVAVIVAAGCIYVCWSST